MSRKGCSPDNSACEGFFGRLKNEMYYGISILGLKHTYENIDKYLGNTVDNKISLSEASVPSVKLTIMKKIELGS